MSYFNQSIIKSKDLKRSKEAIHIDDQFAVNEKEYLEMSIKEKREAMEKDLLTEMEDKREKELVKLSNEIELMKEQTYLEIKKQAEKDAYNKLTKEMGDKLKEDYEKEMARVKSRYYEANHYYIEQESKINEKKQHWIRQNESQIIEILLLTLEKMLAKTIKMDAESVKNLLNDSLKEINDQSKNVWVRMNPKSKEVIEDSAFINGQNDRIEIVSDPTLDKLDILIESEDEWIDSTIKNKLDKVKEILKDWVEENEPLK